MDTGSLAIFLGFRDSIKKLDDRPFDLSFLAPALYEEAKKRGADSNLLSLIGSWGDTLSDSELLEIMKEQNMSFSHPNTVSAEETLRKKDEAMRRLASVMDSAIDAVKKSAINPVECVECYAYFDKDLNFTTERKGDITVRLISYPLRASALLSKN